jgi:hypothetical protein
VYEIIKKSKKERKIEDEVRISSHLTLLCEFDDRKGHEKGIKEVS